MRRSLRSLLDARAAGAKAEPVKLGRVLAVDDDPSVLEFVSRALHEAGYETVRAASGSDALTLAEQSEGFDLLVTDMMMPRMPGDEVARLLRQLQPGLKVLYLTGYSDRLFRAKNMLWADEAYLEKPCSLEALLEAVALLMRGRLR